MGSLLRLSIQNMLTLVSVNLMLFLDRIILAKHSLDSLNAAVTAGAICNIFIFGAIAIVGIGDVFIGQFYGAGRTHKIGQVLWQMMWLCLGLAFVFNIIAQVMTPHLYPVDTDALANTYFSWQMSVGFLPVVVAALTSFFVGTKRFGFALLAVIIASLIKLTLVIPLVFGVEGFFLGLGVKGAIVATALSQVVHITILGCVVIKKTNRHRFGSLNWRFRPALFIECMRLGFPQSVGSMLSYTAWGIVVSLLAAAGQKHLMMYTIIDSTYNLLCFATEGLQKSVLSISANLIGSGRSGETSKLFHKALRLLVPILVVLSIPLLLFPSVVARGLDIDVLSSQQISLACFVIWLYFGFDGLSWILNGLLTAMGDTLFVNPISGVTSFVGVGATYMMTEVNHCRPEVTCWVSIIYGVVCSMLLLARYQSRRRDVSALPVAYDFAKTPGARRQMPTLYGTAPSNGG
jgi:multidrug resistance protein, MATE family